MQLLEILKPKQTLHRHREHRSHRLCGTDDDGYVAIGDESISATVLGMLMAFLSVLWQTLKAARTNPAEALKKE